MLGIFFFQAEDGIRDLYVTGVQTCALPISQSGTLRRSSFEPHRVRQRRARSARARRRRHRTAAERRRRLRVRQHRRSEERREGKSVGLGGRRSIKKENRTKQTAGRTGNDRG